MSVNEARLVSVPEPRPAVLVSFPGRAGRARGHIQAIEVRSNGVWWCLVRLPHWARWSTQTAVGRKAHEGIGPDFVDMWAPEDALEAGDGVVDPLLDLVYGAESDLAG